MSRKFEGDKAYFGGDRDWQNPRPAGGTPNPFFGGDDDWDVPDTSTDSSPYWDTYDWLEYYKSIALKNN